MRLSVVIPAHDAAPYLGAAIDSVLAELPGDAEVIVVDDGSTDATPEILAGYGDRLRVIRRPMRSDAGTARNAGAAAARGAILAFHDADDLALPGRFSTLLARLDADPALDLAFGNGVKLYPDGSMSRPAIRAAYARLLKRRVGPQELLLGSWIYPQATCLRTERFRELGGFASVAAEDWEFALRASLRLRIAFVDVPVFAYRQHATSVSMQQFDFVHAMLALVERFVAEHPELATRMPRREIEHAIARYEARAAQHHARAGDVPGARALLSRAIARHPTSLRYRWRHLKLRLAPAPAARVGAPT